MSNLIPGRHTPAVAPAMSSPALREVPTIPAFETTIERIHARVAPAGLAGVTAPLNRFLVQTERGLVRVRGLPCGRLTATEARAFAAWLLFQADQVASAEDVDFQDLFAALLAAKDPGVSAEDAALMLRPATPPPAPAPPASSSPSSPSSAPEAFEEVTPDPVMLED